MNPEHRQPLRSVLGLAIVAMFLSLIVGTTSTSVAQEDFGQPNPNQSVYDRAGLLSVDEISSLEQRATEVEQAGAPVIIFLQEKEADFDETLEDGRSLMEAWDVQSSPGARDGVVIFLNLEPDDPRHGQLAVVAGEAHFDGGNLPQYQLDRITSEMRSILADEETAAGIARGLEMISQSLVAGPPPPPEPSRTEEVATDLSEGPFSIVNILSVLLSIALLAFGVKTWRERPIGDATETVTTTPPGDLMPAAVGALVDGRVNDMEIEAALLDLARRDTLAIEPADEKKKVQIRLLDASVLQNEFEELVWNALESEAGSDALVPSNTLSKVRSHWGPAKDALRGGLESRGWFDPGAERRRLPLYILGAVAILLAIVVFVILVIGSQL